MTYRRPRADTALPSTAPQPCLFVFLGRALRPGKMLGLAAMLLAAAPADASQKHKLRFKPFEAFATQRHVSANAYRQRESKRVAESKKEAKQEQPAQPPLGPFHIIVSINSQRLSLYSNGVQIAQAPVSTGTPGHPTPMGVFSVIQKQKWHQSNLYSGAPMPYMQRITWSGVAMHAGVLPGYPASHGCIRMPAEFAVRLYGLTKMGARVIIARNDAAPVEIAHPRLFLPKKPGEGLLVVNQPANASSAAEAVKAAQAAIISMDATTPVGAMATAAAVKTAENTDAAKASDAAKPADVAVAKAKQASRRNGPVSVFVSRKQQKLFVRQNFQPLFEAPVTIQNPELPLGTHVLTAMELKDDGAAMRWTAVSIPSAYPRGAEPAGTRGKKISREERERQARVSLPVLPTAAQALDRIEMPRDATDRISEMLSPGSSLVISDNGISDETGIDTDFVVLTR